MSVMPSWMNGVLTGSNVIHGASSIRYDVFNILFLCEGFSDSEDDRKRFNDVCKNLAVDFFKIAPFSFCRDYINLLALFTPSPKPTIPDLDWNEYDPTVEREADAMAREKLDEINRDTNFGTFTFTLDTRIDIGSEVPSITPLGSKVISFTTTGRQNLTNLLTKITFTHGNKDFKGSDIWVNKRSKSHGAVCVILNASELRAVHTYDIIAVDLTGYDEGKKDLVFTLAHEIGHAVKDYGKKGLADEYEAVQETSNIYNGEEPTAPNVTAVKTVRLDSSGKIDTKKIKWRHLIANPEMLEPGRPPYVLYNSNLQEIKNDPRFNDPLYSSDDVKLVEGGGLFSGGIFRSNLACIMRNGHDENAEFCRVCQYYIRKTITGLAKLEIGMREPYEIIDLFDAKKLMKRLFSSLDNNFDYETKLKKPIALQDLTQCGLIVARIAIMLDQLGVHLKKQMMSFVFADQRAFIRYGNVIIDPTFYHVYKTNDVQHPYQYIFKGQAHQFVDVYFSNPNEKFNFLNKAFAGDIIQMVIHCASYLPIQYMTLMPIGTEMVFEAFYDYIFGSLENALRLKFDIPGCEIDVNAFKFIQLPEDEQSKVFALQIEKELKQYDEYNKAKKTGNIPADLTNSWGAIEEMYKSIVISLD